MDKIMKKNIFLIFLVIKMLDFTLGVFNPQTLFFQKSLALFIVIIAMHFLIFLIFGLFSLIRGQGDFNFILNQTVYSVIAIACANFISMLYLGEEDISGISFFALALFSFFEVVLGLIASSLAYFVSKLVIKK